MIRRFLAGASLVLLALATFAATWAGKSPGGPCGPCPFCR